MIRFVVSWLFLAAIQAAVADELTLNRQLIVACYKRDVANAVRCLRSGANVNARFGDWTDNMGEHFCNRWTGAISAGVESWTSLLALAGSDDLPDPPAELWEQLSKTWEPERVAALQKKIPQEKINQRRAEAMIILHMLLSHGCSIDHDDGFGATALFKAADELNVPMVRVLLKFGANPNTKTGIYIDGAGDLTPLHVACNSEELIQLLLDYGADASAKDTAGRTPSDWVSFVSERTFNLVKTPAGWRIQPRGIGR